MSRKGSIITIVSTLIIAATAYVVAVAVNNRLHSSDTQPEDPAAFLVLKENKDFVTTEAGVEGSRELAIQNQAERPLAISLESTDCTCVRAYLCLAPENRKGADAKEMPRRGSDLSLTWQELEKRGKSCTIPPKAHGILRLTWKTPIVGEHVFWANFLVEDGPNQGNRRVEVPVRLVESVSLRAEQDLTARMVDVGSMRDGQKCSASFVCFSQTRDEFSITAAPPQDDPHAEYAAPQTLASKELQALSEKLKLSVRAAYRVGVTIHEHVGKQRLDIGPFHRMVAWKIDVPADLPGHQLTAHVDGTVHGEVWLKTPEGKAFIDLGTIKPSDSKSVLVTLLSRDPQLSLTVDEEQTLNIVKVELLDGKVGTKSDTSKTWQVRVQFRWESFFRGPFPNPDRPGYESAALCSAVFRITRQGATSAKDQSPRRLLVPIRGNVRSF
jgi:hypothetical protein